MTLARRLGLSALLLVLLFATDLFADVIVFKNGGTWTGKIVEETEKQVVMEVDGLGRLTAARTEIREILRKGPEPEAPKKGERGEVLRIEDEFIWSGTRRRGTRSIRVRRMDDGSIRLEEQTVFYDEKGDEESRTFLDEHTDAALEPKSIVYREQGKDGAPTRTVRGVVRDGSLHLSISLPGKKAERFHSLPEGVRFPLSAREQVFREKSRIKGKYEIPVYDPLKENFYRYTFSVLPTRTESWEDKVVTVSVIRRHRSGRTPEEIWLNPAGLVLMEQLNGPNLVAIRTRADLLRAYREGKKVEASAEEARAKPLYVHPEAGFRITKPGMSWVFKKVGGGTGKILELHYQPCFAYVEIIVKEGVPEGGLASSLSVQMEKEFSSGSEDFKKLSDGFLKVGGEQACRILARSKNKGEVLNSELVGFLHGGRTWYVILAAPPEYFEAARPEFVRILDSLEFIEVEKRPDEHAPED